MVTNARAKAVTQTFLFVPAHDVRKVGHAVRSSADGVIFDLEAAVPDSMKAEARRALTGHLVHLRGTGTPEFWVRVNSRPRQFQADVDAIDFTAVDGVLVAQSENVDSMCVLHSVGARRIIPMIESAAGFSSASVLARAPGVERFALGTWDLALDLGLHAVTDPDDSELIWQLRGHLVLASRQAGLRAPIDGIHSRLDDEEGLRRACERARLLGFEGKLLIHPRQIPIATAAFRPSDDQLQFAREVLEAYERATAEGVGAIQVRGRIVDLPVVGQARAMVARWT
jgi:citrate lyase beta subunit